MAVGVALVAAVVVVVVLAACAVFSFGFLGPGDTPFLEIELAVEAELDRLVEAKLPVEVVDMALPVLAIFGMTRPPFAAMGSRFDAPAAVVWSAGERKNQVSRGFGITRCMITLGQVFDKKGNEVENVITSTTLNPNHGDVAPLAARSIMPWLIISVRSVWVSLSLV
jgi:hypothetical protein